MPTDSGTRTSGETEGNGEQVSDVNDLIARARSIMARYGADMATEQAARVEAFCLAMLAATHGAPHCYRLVQQTDYAEGRVTTRYSFELIEPEIN